MSKPSDTSGMKPSNPPSNPSPSDTDLELASYQLRCAVGIAENWCRESRELIRTRDDSCEWRDRANRISAKQAGLWKFVRAGLRGTSEKVPRELVYEEYQLSRLAMKQVYQRVGKNRDVDRILSALEEPVNYVLGGDQEMGIQRHFSVKSKVASVRLKKMKGDGRTAPSDFAYVLAGLRFGISTSAAEKLAKGKDKKPKRRGNAGVMQSTPLLLLASVVFDMCMRQEPEMRDQRTHVFETLVIAGYPIMHLYYRLRHALADECELTAGISDHDLAVLIAHVQQNPVVSPVSDTGVDAM